jgi:ABC-type methionine transport system permease subunit
MKELTGYTDFLMKETETLLNIDSPTGYTENAAAWVEEEFAKLGFETERTRKGGVLQGRLPRVLYLVVNPYVNVIRSVPFVILLVTIMPLTRLIMGTTIGSTAALVPLVLYISPYLARLLENSLLECSPGILEAA